MLDVWSMKSFSLLLFIPSGLVAWAVLYGTFPLGVPGEWTWDRVASVESLSLLLAVPVIVACCYLGFAWLGARRVGKCGRGELCGWLAGLVAAGFFWLWVVQEAAPPAFQLSKAAWVLYYRGSSGYFTEARQVRDLQDFLAGYETQMSQGDVLHIGTHPPGLIVCFRGLIGLCEVAPQFTQVVLRTQPGSVRESFSVIERSSRRRLAAEDRAALWLAALIVQFFAAATVFPLYALLRGYLPPRTCWLAASVWPATPALALFLPKSDALIPCVGLLFLVLWLEGWRRQSLAACIGAGLVLWMGMGLSLALLPVAFLAAIITLWEFWIERSAGAPEARETGGAARTESKTGATQRLCLSLLGGGLGFLIPCGITWLASGLNLFSVWLWNFRNHAAFYGSYPRTYWKWLLINPVELAVAGGVPVTILAVWSFVREIKRPRSRFTGACWGCAAAWGVLLVSGKNMGEAARLWIVIMPWLIVLAAPLLSPADESGERGWLEPGVDSERQSLIRWGIVLGCQLALTTAIVTHIVGFHVPMLAP